MRLKPKCHYPLGWEHRLNRSQKSGPVFALSSIVLQQVNQFFPILHHSRPQTSAFSLQIRYTLAMGEASSPSTMVWGSVTAWFCSQPPSFVVQGL